MSYVQKVLQPGEKVLVTGHLHWIMYLPGLLWILAGGGVIWARNAVALGHRDFVTYVVLSGLLLIAIGLFRLAYAKFIQWTSEIAVTDRRVIQKSGFIARDTAEMNINQVESVEVAQSVWGRILGYGTLRVHGTGRGMEALRFVADPIAIRTAITAR